MFKGVDLATGTNDPSVSGNFPRRQVVRCVRVDLTDPDIRLLSTPKAANYAVDSRETLTQTVPNFLKRNQLQVASDANYYDANPGGADPSGEGISCDVFGLQISGGNVVSPQTSADVGGDPRYAALLFTTNNQASFVFVNRPPGTNTAGIYTAITGYYPIVSNGVNIGAASITSYPDSWIHQVQPRTAFGLSQDHRYLFLLTIDGRQSGYSDGALDTETAYWMLQFGAWNAINMDGGGSTALYAADSAGNPVALNHSSYLAAYGHERYVGSHFGLAAKPLPGFINDVQALPDDTAATITWSTLTPAMGQVQYGPTTDLGFSTPLMADAVTNHAALLTGLVPGAGYYYQITSTVGATPYVTSNLFFTTLATTNTIFDLTNIWTYTTTNLDGKDWTAPAYDDSSWIGSGPGAFWVDNRGPNFMQDIPIPLLTGMLLDPNTGYPFHTYYLRTHFNYLNPGPGTTAQFETYLDDGAVVYLNGQEIYRLFMPAAPTPILNATLASGYGCSSGDASCPIDFSLSVTTNLVQGDNVLAVEVHNYSAGSPDITFAMSLAILGGVAGSPQLRIVAANGAATLNWDRGGFALQQAPTPAGPWTDTPGPVVSSPFTLTPDGTAKFFRLRR